MSAAQNLTGPIAANNIHKWMRAWHQGAGPDAIDLDLVRQMLPDTPYGQGVREIKAPMAHGLASCEGMLARNPHDDAEWGIFYNGNSPAQRQRFTIAHELGHFVLHRGQQHNFSCDTESVYSGADRMRAIEREADDFASNLLIPGDLLRDAISDLDRTALERRHRAACATPGAWHLPIGGCTGRQPPTQSQARQRIHHLGR